VVLASAQVRIGVAGWSIPTAITDRFDSGGSHLERYASRFDAVEINSSFYRPHRRSTYERWAASVPQGFRFAVKLPRAITHERRLSDCGDLLTRFADEIGGLGEKRGPVLIQLPPKLAFEPGVAQPFLADARRILGGAIVCEPRHASWFDRDADDAMALAKAARVIADPLITPAGSEPGGWQEIVYFRLHGAPHIYRSDYSGAEINRHAARVRDLALAGREVWTIFDNTAAGHAPANALALVSDLARDCPF
jgi:uncharacterized protein YecE (DUF72 family)